MLDTHCKIFVPRGAKLETFFLKINEENKNPRKTDFYSSSQELKNPTIRNFKVLLGGAGEGWSP